MSFLPNNYLNLAVKTPVQRIVDSVVWQTTAGLQQSVTSVAGSLAGSLFNIGQSYDSISSIASLRVDSIVAGGDVNYAGLAGTCVQRVAASDLAGNRGASGISSRKYSTEVTPQGKIQNITTGSNLLIYPPDMSKYRFQMDFKKYERPNPFTPSTSATTFSIVLPIPHQLLEHYDVNYTTPEMGLIGDLTNQFKGSGGLENGNASGSAAAATILRNAAGINAAITTAFEQVAGVAPNPNISVAFKGPSLRQHRFAWLFAPKTPEESATIQKIVKTLKNKMLPKRTFTNQTSLLAYPDMVNITLFPHPYYDFKTCVIDNINVSYSVSGVPSFFKGTNLPQFIALEIGFQELEFFLSDDVDKEVSIEGLKGIVKSTYDSLMDGSDKANGSATSFLEQSGVQPKPVVPTP